MATFSNQALKAELLTDPNGYGYAPLVAAGSVSLLADMLNLLRAGTSVKRTDVTPLEILEAIDIRDLDTAANLDAAGVKNIPLAQSWFESITQFPTVRLFNDNGSASKVKSNIDRLVTNTNGSQGRLNAVGTREGSRAEVLWGPGTVITFQMVTAALAS